MTIPLWILLRMRNFWTEVVKNTTHVLCSIIFSENCAVWEIMWKNIVEPDRPQMTIWCTCIACWMIKATNTHSECVIHIAFPQQQLSHERASVLHFVYITCLVAASFWLYFAIFMQNVLNINWKVYEYDVLLSGFWFCCFSPPLPPTLVWCDDFLRYMLHCVVAWCSLFRSLFSCGWGMVLATHHI